MVCASVVRATVSLPVPPISEVKLVIVATCRLSASLPPTIVAIPAVTAAAPASTMFAPSASSSTLIELNPPKLAFVMVCASVVRATVSVPVPPASAATPAIVTAVANTIMSSPFPPRIESVPPPPTMESLSSPPRRVSFAALPTTVSLPAFPRIESPPAFPVMELAALFPIMELLEAFPIALMAFDPVSSTLLIVPAKIVIEEKPPEISTLEEEARTSKPASAPVRMLVVPVARLTS